MNLVIGVFWSWKELDDATESVKFKFLYGPCSIDVFSHWNESFVVVVVFVVCIPSRRLCCNSQIPCNGARLACAMKCVRNRQSEVRVVTFLQTEYQSTFSAETVLQSSASPLQGNFSIKQCRQDPYKKLTYPETLGWNWSWWAHCACSGWN